MKKYGRKYVEASKKEKKNKLYSVDEATELVTKTGITKFDGTVDFYKESNVIKYLALFSKFLLLNFLHLD